jgi:hypothetical protein
VRARVPHFFRAALDERDGMILIARHRRRNLSRGYLAEFVPRTCRLRLSARLSLELKIFYAAAIAISICELTSAPTTDVLRAIEFS